ncbi:LuxR family transcriptional regulator [Streptomyces venezuelae]|uniref:helix-turn-helix transcriptional regulator n=1 Tax=Streptomyces venezuelae TaxID=54571 RepID=UPI001238A090|nr:LuxR family transcriptional regulator [Streptomyces venezuelae]QES04768.1 LuxR family transcriptional regulator [Streptomyces venezuelae]
MDTSADPGCADRAPLAGRAAELARLDALLRGRGTGAGGAGGPVAVDVTGEPGIGKTRLLTEFATRARRAGATVLRGRVTPPDPHPGPSFHPFTDAFADLDPGDRTRFPELAERAEEAGAGGGPGATDPGGEPEPHHDRATPEATRTSRRPRAHPDDQIRRVAAALGRLAGAAPAPERDPVSCPAPAPGPDPEGAGPAPEREPEVAGPASEREPEVAAAGQPRTAVAARGLVIVLDDFQGADPASVALVDHLLRHPLRAPVLLVLARRERQTPPALASVLARAADAGALTRLALGPLTPEECAEGLTPGLTRQQAGEVHALGLGNPLYHRALAHARTHREEAPGAGPVAVLLAELSPLRPLERSVVDSLAVLDGRATTALLAAVAHPADEAAFDAALGELSRRDLVRGGEDGRVLVLRHPALAELLRGTLAPWRRRELHRRAADALARAGASVTERAPHLVRAATAWDPVVGAELTEAAERIGAADPGRAADWLAAVLGLLPDTAEHRAAWRDLTLRRARALGSAGRVAESRDLLHHLIDACATDATDGIDGTDETRTSAVLLCAFMERHLGRYPEADALLRRELERTPGPRPDLRTWLVVEWGCRALFAARYPEVRPVLADTLAEARRRCDDAGTAEVLTLAALGEAYEGETTAARVHAAEAAALTGTFTDGELADHAESLVRLSWTEVFLEQYGTAERHATRGIAMARRAGRPFALSQLLLCSAYVHFLTGRVGAALDLADESLAVARTLGGAELVGFSGAIRAVVLLHARPLGDPEALAAAEEAAATVGTAEGWWATQARCLLGYCVPLGEDPHRVREVLVRAGGDRNLSRLQPSLRPGYLELLAGAALATGDLAEAERVARRALAEAEPLGLPAQRAAALRAWGQVLARRGEPAAAAKALTEAVRESARSGATVREAHSLLLAAPYVRAAGDGTTAAALWRRGRRLAADGGARLLADVADHTWPGTRSAPEGGVAGGRLAVLTPREREISVLVAEGLTNQAVAERLCLSPRTVESHVARVYRKTGVETRAGLASLVVRDGVVRDGVGGVGIGGAVGGGHFSRG